MDTDAMPALERTEARTEDGLALSGASRSISASPHLSPLSPEITSQPALPGAPHINHSLHHPALQAPGLLAGPAGPVSPLIPNEANPER